VNQNQHHHSTEPTVSPFAVSKAVSDRVANYSPRLLTDSQRAFMLEDIKRLVLRAEPASATTAGHLLASICKFVRDTAPGGGCALSDVLTSAQVTTWIAAHKKNTGNGRSLSQDHIHLRCLLRVHQQLPAKVASARPRLLAAAPLRRSDVAELADVCRMASRPAARGFVAAFGANLSGRAGVGSRFEHVGGELVLRTADGEYRALVTRLQWPELDGMTVCDGDWDEV
jgi:hypothetical protein